MRCATVEGPFTEFHRRNNYFRDHHDGELEVGMVTSIESYAGAVGGAEGVELEEQVEITDDGPLLLSAAPSDERPWPDPPFGCRPTVEA